MRRNRHGLICFGFWMVLTAVGCSGEGLPPVAAVSAAGAGQPTKAGVAASAGQTAQDTPASDLAHPSAAVPETADAAVLGLHKRLMENQPDALWDALPGSYQRDLNDLVHLFAHRVHPDVWRWCRQIARKGATAARLMSEKVTAADSDEGLKKGTGTSRPSESLEDSEGALGASPLLRQASAEKLASLAALFDRIGNGGPDFVERLKTADLGELLRSEGRPLMALFRGFLDPALLPPLDLREISVSLKESSGDSAVVEIRYSYQHHDEVDFVRIEGKWLPKWLAERWAAGIAAAAQAIRDDMPSQAASDNFGKTFQVLAAADFCMDSALQWVRNSGGNVDEIFSELVFQPLILLHYLLTVPQAGKE